MPNPSYKRPAFYLLALFVALALLGILQDYIHASVRDVSFYWSESTLYKIVWLLFVPLLPLGLVLQRKMTRVSFLRPWPGAILLSLGFSLAHLLLSALSVHWGSALLLEYTFTVRQVFNFFLAEQWYMIVLIYGGGFSYGVWQLQKAAKTSPKPLSVLSVKYKEKIIPLPASEIVYIKTDRPYLAIVTPHNKYLHSETLAGIQSKLDAQQFVRVHRSTIINLHHIDFFRSRANGDYDITMTNGEQIRMSRNYTPQFKEKLKDHPPPSSA